MARNGVCRGCPRRAVGSFSIVDDHALGRSEEDEAVLVVQHIGDRPRLDRVPAEDREVMLFRTCRNNGSDDEIHQHRGYGGLPSTMVDAILADDPSNLAAWPQVLCRMCDEMSRNAKLTESSVAALVDHDGTEDHASRAIMVMAWFNMLSRLVDSTGVRVETGENPYEDIAGPAVTR